ncbi:MAG: phosphotransferase enzyme family protein [Acidimicrobiales bacterium]
MTRRLSAQLAVVIAHRVGRRSTPELVRSGANEVYAVDDLVIRIAPPGSDGAAQAAAARMLAGHGIALPALVDSGIVDDQPYTIWERIPADPGTVVDFRGLGAEIGRLHRIDPAALDGLATLPWCDEASWLDLDTHLDAAEAADVVSPADIEILRASWVQLRSWGSRCRTAGQPVVCHGDVHPQNVIMRHGKPIVIDWDTLCLGPPQWDHAALMTWAGRWGGSPDAYPRFAAGYGRNFAGDDLANDLARLRLLAPTVNLIVKGASDARYAAEAQRRMRYWRGEPAAPAWTPQ